MVAEKKIAMLLPRGEEKSEEDGLIVIHRQRATQQLSRLFEYMTMQTKVLHQ